MKIVAIATKVPDNSFSGDASNPPVSCCGPIIGRLKDVWSAMVPGQSCGAWVPGLSSQCGARAGADTQKGAGFTPRPVGLNCVADLQLLG
ncbi:hypothetical protein [Novosphingobium sp.]|uniref:hypothetical protein n=1 Tax=Novosphingobium sp. TaxID=1874826 RepID=UPI003341D2C6